MIVFETHAQLEMKNDSGVDQKYHSVFKVILF